MPVPGWYPDPNSPNSQRWWDGTAWTDATQAMYPGASGPGSTDIGLWLQRSLTVVKDNLLSLSILLAVQIVLSAFLGWLVLKSLDRILISDLSDEGDFPFKVSLEGSPLWLVAVVVVGFFVMLVGLWLNLATVDLMHRSHKNVPESLSVSLQNGAKRIPRFFGWSVVQVLVIMGGVFGVLGIGILLTIIGGPVGVVYMILAVPAIIVFVVWVAIKTSFLEQSSVLAPSGSSGWVASFNVSRGRFFSSVWSTPLAWNHRGGNRPSCAGSSVNWRVWVTVT